MPAAEIHNMTVQDMTRVIEIEKQSFTHKWSLNNFISELLHPDSICKTACVDDSGTAVGYICVRLMVDEVHILKLAVHPDYRRRHIGSILVKHVMAEVIKDFAVILEVRVSNLPAICLYDSLGFKSLYTRRRYYAEPEEDAVVMAFDLNSRD
ncbi:ribosomal protein S18-alanine N-acetyltransferase [Candidatus Magnetominusculus xianensis]|uniref:[Ribosomal protein bS18]-alanine N-acetyltransferase n=1 Tax=Candidatus Magnetominusculus xianensis TaxID=1748249 RepID=A0ABR5SCQ6_9BACT|nr:ribosomal protein S18-alanine N-acetyltransferase [Candidatus Magnetominusculus xianensis]KWT82072.1 ribosomal-protein-alanine N-acetyltransferase [Candidatus Magnetominusculus xianensis]MBF0404432.1 ribosomal protein S18-alanine N-acetyltransferase [Nitrospirota bacterium]